MQRPALRAAARMARRLLLALTVAGAPAVASAQQASPRFIPRDENPEDFPPGPGREDAFYSCTACHGFKLIAQQGLARWQWEASIDLMVAKHAMPPLDARTRESVLNYLEATYPPRTQRGWQNPFLNR